MNDEDIVCYCLGVSVKDIKDAIASGCQKLCTGTGKDRCRNSMWSM